jgi:N-acetylglucosamine-6-phosphate deacetylase
MQTFLQSNLLNFFMPQAFSTKSLFTGLEWKKNVVVKIDNGLVVSIDQDGFDANNSTPFIVPAFIDLQLYGAGGKLLSEFPEKATIEKIYDYSLAGGAAFFQPTIASQSNAVIYQSIDAVKAYKAAGGKGCIGLHIEGPWINKNKKGAHDETVIHSPSMDEVLAILDYGSGAISMITLAPEICTPEIIETIQAAGIVVSAGHTNASYEVATGFFNNGIKTATHLFNAMSGLQHRAPGVVGALFNHPTAMSSIVVDGYHVDFAAIQIATKIMGERLFCITDAVTETNTGLYQHKLVGDKFESAGTLSGSALTQLKSVQNLVQQVGLPVDEAIKMCSLYPAKLMQSQLVSGTIEVNKNANLLFLSAALAFENIIVNN